MRMESVLASNTLERQNIHTGNEQRQKEISSLGIGKFWSSSALLCDLKKLTLLFWALFSSGVTEEERASFSLPYSQRFIKSERKAILNEFTHQYASLCGQNIRNQMALGQGQGG